MMDDDSNIGDGSVVEVDDWWMECCDEKTWKIARPWWIAG